MSDPVAPMKNASYSDGIAHISEVPPLGMITLRGDLAARPFRKALKSIVSLEVPAPREIAFEGDYGVAWMSPDELLVICDYAQAHDRLHQLQDATADQYALAVNVSDARAVFDVTGPNAREVMAKLAPVDLAPGQFGPGQIRRTRLAQVAAAFWMPAEDHFRVVCFRSVAQYVFDLLTVAAQPGSEVNVFQKVAQES